MPEDAITTPVPPPVTEPHAAETKGFIGKTTGQDPAQTPEQVATPPAASDGTKPPEAKSAGDKGKPEDEDRVPRGVQRRIDRLTREKYELQGRLKALEDRQASGAEPPRSGKTADGRPTMDDPKYQSYEDYVVALAEYTTDQKMRAAHEAEARTAAEKQMAEAIKTWETRVEAVSKQAGYEDFEDVLHEADDIDSGNILPILLESEYGPQIAYHLAQNLDEARRIAALAPVTAAREIGKLEVKFAADPKVKPKAPGRGHTPLEPVTSGGGSSPVDLTDPKTDFPAWERARNQQLRAR